ncbi:DUF2934 domain-containing protein [Singulisphaera acidiphila]|uniref:DUF2934 domain-containing protein n=1 Tax=Singulisphaera acidiphila (strain ATCC BAA-1392 / DSM 18658 / VKM B-2454 / MOB10) TaxID=886293 RepID=L0DBY3_SINAD|nr:DUF2934 domain-containing protein [Singulisphaera acidiphila]AGA26360.1 Protein of unknown function (DUF2934) [Singulisphaera acidiphila DSM 18658]
MSTKTRRDHRSDHSSNTETREGPAEKPAPSRQKVIDEERSRLIQVRAYELWEQAGKPDGDVARERFWSEAEKEIMATHARDR